MTDISLPTLLQNCAMTWGENLPHLSEEQCDIDIPDGMTLPDDPSDDQIDELYRAYVALNPVEILTIDQRNALSMLSADVSSCTIDPLECPRIMSRLATLIGIGAIPWANVMDALASSAASKTALGRRYSHWWVYGHNALLDFRDDNAKKPAEPIFNSDEYIQLAVHVHKQGLHQLRAMGGDKFFLNGRRIPRHLVDSAIQAILERCFIWDARTRTRIHVSNRLVSEVRCAFARKWPVLGEADHSAEATSIYAAQAEPFAVFLKAGLKLDASAWTSSEIVWERCSSASANPLVRETLFKELVDWGDGGIRRMRKKIGRKRVPGYLGIGVAETAVTGVAGVAGVAGSATRNARV